MTPSEERFERIERTLEQITARLDRLTERHEALAESMELMRHQSQEQQNYWDQRWRVITATVERIARATEIHERRLDDLEGRSR